MPPAVWRKPHPRTSPGLSDTETETERLAPERGAYAGERISLLTQHGKERVIAPALEGPLGCTVELVSGYDTDQLGTFTRETPRHGSQLDAATRKARIGLALAGASVGVASEGSFDRDPFTGLLPWNVEIVVLVDDVRGVTLVGSAQGAAKSGHLCTDTWEAAERFARESGFPEHGLVVRPDNADDGRIIKGLHSWESYAEAFWRSKALAANGTAFVEVDLRAHANPTRMGLIRLAAEDLASKLCSRCPSCEAPGFWVVERRGGLQCASCGFPTRETLSEVWGCASCGMRESREVGSGRQADPGRCDICNP